MMNSLLPSPDAVQYSSKLWHESISSPGVRFATKRMSLGTRLSLTERLRVLLQKYEFLRAGDTLENTEADIADLLVRRLYLECCLIGVEGLVIDGMNATVQLVIERGPEDLTDEIVAAIRNSLALSDDEAKNY